MSAGKGVTSALPTEGGQPMERPAERSRADVPLGALGNPSADLRLPVPPEWIELVAERAAQIVAAEHRPAEDAQPYLTVTEAAEYLRCRPKRIYDLTGQRRLPFVKDGSRTLLRRADLDAYLEGGGS